MLTLRRLGAALKDSKAEKGEDLLRIFRQTGEALRDAHRTINEAYRKQETLGQDADWLLDNYHIIVDALTELSTDLPEEYCDQLPKVQSGPFKGFPRVYLAALDLNAHRDSSLDESSITRFVAAFQTDAPLTVGEIWAVPIMLRLCLLENLRRLAEHIVQFRVHHQRAHLWIASNVGGAEHFPASTNFGLDAVQELWRDCYVVHLLEGLHHYETVHPEGVEHLERRLADRQQACADVLRREKERQAANQVSIGNCVTSLRLLSALDWRALFEQTSLLEQALRLDPMGIYARQDFATRDR